MKFEAPPGVVKRKAVADTPRNGTHIIVTEYGWADLKGKTIHQRAEALIGLAHPKFRDKLEQPLR